jgi:serine/threonine protein kinase
VLGRCAHSPKQPCASRHQTRQPVLDKRLFHPSRRLWCRTYDPTRCGNGYTRRYACVYGMCTTLLGSSSAPLTRPIGMRIQQAPEILFHKPYTKSVDIWSVCCCLFAMTCPNINLDVRTVRQLSSTQSEQVLILLCNATNVVFGTA